MTLELRARINAFLNPHEAEIVRARMLREWRNEVGKLQEENAKLKKARKPPAPRGVIVYRPDGTAESYPAADSWAVTTDHQLRVWGRGDEVAAFRAEQWTHVEAGQPEPEDKT